MPAQFSHPTKEIKGDEGDELEDYNIALCITGSVASIKSPKLARNIMRHGAEVRVIMSQEATDLITPQLMHWATGNEVKNEITGGVEHVDIGKWADIFLVAPATMNTISKIANGIADTPPTATISVAMGEEKTILIVPAMHESMYSYDIIQENVSKLKKEGIQFLEPDFEEGKAKLPATSEIVDKVIDFSYPNDLAGKKVLVTAGPTEEEIDPVRVLTNKSSGKMGIQIAKIAKARGADVTLVYGPGSEEPPFGVETIDVKTTGEMLEAVEGELEKNKYDLIAAAAAPQDFKSKVPAEEKLRREEGVSIDFVPTSSVLERAGEIATDAYLVGFKAECDVSDDELQKIAKEKLEDYGLDLIVANDVMRPDAGFEIDMNDVFLINESESTHMKGSKAEIADSLLDIYCKSC